MHVTYWLSAFAGLALTGLIVRGCFYFGKPTNLDLAAASSTNDQPSAPRVPKNRSFFHHTTTQKHSKVKSRTKKPDEPFPSRRADPSKYPLSDDTEHFSSDHTEHCSSDHTERCSSKQPTESTLTESFNNAAGVPLPKLNNSIQLSDFVHLVQTNYSVLSAFFPCLPPGLDLSNSSGNNIFRMNGKVFMTGDWKKNLGVLVFINVPNYLQQAHFDHVIFDAVLFPEFRSLLLNNASTLLALSFNHCTFSKQSKLLSELHRFPALQQFQLRDSNVSEPEIISLILNLPNAIRSLDISAKATIPDGRLGQRINAWEELEELRLDGLKIKDFTLILSILAKKTLKKLQISNSNFGAVLLDGLTNSYGWTDLSVTHDLITKSHLPSLLKLPNLTTVDLSGTKISVAEIVQFFDNDLKKFPLLNRITANGCVIGENLSFPDSFIEQGIKLIFDDHDFSVTEANWMKYSAISTSFFVNRLGNSYVIYLFAQYIRAAKAKITDDQLIAENKRIRMEKNLKHNVAVEQENTPSNNINGANPVVVEPTQSNFQSLIEKAIDEFSLKTFGHITNLSVNYCCNLSHLESISSFLRCLPNLKTLSLDFLNWNELSIPDNFPSTKLGIESLTIKLSDIKRLENFTISFLQLFRDVKKIEFICPSRFDVSQLTALSFPQLEVLQLSAPLDFAEAESFFRWISTLPKLTSLCVKFDRKTEKSYRLFSFWKTKTFFTSIENLRLENLELSFTASNSIEKELKDLLPKLSNLLHLSVELKNTNDYNAILSSNSYLKQLRSLNINGALNKKQAYQLISIVPSLHYLTKLKCFYRGDHILFFSKLLKAVEHLPFDCHVDVEKAEPVGFAKTINSMLTALTKGN